MFVCLCTGATRHVVADVVAGGACTSSRLPRRAERAPTAAAAGAR